MNLSDLVGADASMPMNREFIDILCGDTVIDNMVLLKWEDGEELLADMQTLARARVVLNMLKEDTREKVVNRMIASANGCHRAFGVCWSV